MEISLSLLLRLSLLLLNFTSILTSSAIDIDKLSLISFKTTITSDPNGILTKNWSTATSVCTWIGVTCDVALSRVTALNVSRFALRGSVAPHIGNLTYLRWLDMSFNNLNGVIPSELSSLRRLEEINVGDNEFRGEIPSWLGGLTQLRRLDLSSNNFTGVIPPSLFNVSRLEMGYNGIGGNIPAEVGNLSSLEVLDLYGNQVTGRIPGGIFKISSLKELNLKDNQLSGNLPGEICRNARQLKVINLQKNQLSGEIPASICECRELEKLSLYDNRFSGSIPPEIGCLTMLKFLALGINSLKGGIPKQLGNLTSLTHVDLRRNNLEGELPREVGGLRFLESFIVSGNNLWGSIPSSIFNVSTLHTLNLQSNQFDGKLPSDMGASLPNLKWLYLTHNRFTGPIPASIANASNLNLLEIGNNSFTGSVPNFGDHLTQLRILRIWGNNLTGVQFLTSLIHCPYLEEVDVSRNPLNGLLPASIGNFSSSFSRFEARECNIHGVIPPEMGNLTSLITLDLKKNQLTGSIPSAMGKLNHLQEMSLSANRLQGNIPDELCRMTSLWDLFLQQNMLWGLIPECLGEVGSLRLIVLSNNNFNSTIPASLWDLRDLLRLDLSFNHLRGQLSYLIGNLKAISEIDLSFNHFSGDIPSSISRCQSLEFLCLSNNMLGGSIPQSLGSLRGLTTLDLSNNNLSGVIPPSLEELRFLDCFNVSYNRLSGLIPDEGIFVNFTALSFINNSGLCGSAKFRVPPCMKKHGTKRVVGLMVYVVVPFLVLAVVLVMIVFVLFVRRRKHDTRTPDPPALGAEWRRVSHRELVQGTNGFSDENLLGRGSLGSVYRVRLEDGLDVAVKVFNLESETAAKSFDNECEILSSIRHRNLVSVTGCCSNTEFKALILTYMPNGSLDKWLYSDECSLNLIQRLNVAIDIALALEHLHHGHPFTVVHCDIKPLNVLLDQDMTAHVADFGIAKLFDQGESAKQTTTLLATIGYAPPEYGLEGKVSTSGDVYSYGVLLLEMFTRKKPTDDMFHGEMGLKEWVVEAVERNAVSEVVDSGLVALQDRHDSLVKEDCILSVFDLAMKCLAISPRERINMIQVVNTLEKIRARVVSTRTRARRCYPRRN